MGAVRLQRVNTDLVQHAVLAVLAEDYQRFEDEFVSLESVKARIPAFGLNYLRDALTTLTNNQLAVRHRKVQRGYFGGGVMGGAGEEVFTDNWRVTTKGLQTAIAFQEANPDVLDRTVVPLEEDERQTNADTWQPLPIDRTDESYMVMVAEAEAAIREVEQNNGYAASEPEERAGILNVMKGTLQAIKEGLPSRAVIVAGLLSPLKFLSEKFSAASIGEIAKKAVEALLNWLP